MFFRLLAVIGLLFSLTASAFAQQGDAKPLIDALGKADFKQAEALIGQIAATAMRASCLHSKRLLPVNSMFARPTAWCFS